jgi:hypothetical protein
MQKVKLHKFFNKNTKSFKKFFLAVVAVLLSVEGFAGTNNNSDDYDSIALFLNPMFLILAGIITLLLIIIAVLGSALKNIGRAALERKTNNNAKIFGAVLFFVLLSKQTMYAQEVFYTVKSGNEYGGLSFGLFWFLIVIIVFELLIIAVLSNSIKVLAKNKERESIAEVKHIEVEQT